MTGDFQRLICMALEDIVNNSETPKRSFLWRWFNSPKRGLLAKIFDYGVAIAATAVSYSLVGPIALVGTGIAVVGDYFAGWKRGEKTSSASTRDSSILSAIWTPIGSYIFSFMNTQIDISTLYGKAARGLAQLVAFPLTIGPLGSMSDYVIRRKQITGTIEYIKKYFMEGYFDSLKYLGIPRLLVAYTLPPPLQYPIDIGLRFLRRMGNVAYAHRTAGRPYEYAAA